MPCGCEKTRRTPAGCKQIQHQMPERGRNESESLTHTHTRIGVRENFIYAYVLEARAGRQTVAVAVSAPQNVCDSRRREDELVSAYMQIKPKIHT
jgi:hypothetical protein